MNVLTKLTLTLAIAAFMCADVMAQRGGRGQSRQGNRNNQSARGSQGQNGFGQNSRGKNSQGQNAQGQNGRGQNGQGQGRGQNGQGQGGNGQNGRGQGGNGQGGSSTSITNQERSELMLMREEEKLARDVYVALNKKWGATIFANISRAESKHMQAVAGLLSRYGIPDPVVSNTPGTFTNPRFKQLYQSLVNEGSASLVSALKVGLKIEEMDIADLRRAIQATNNNDIQRVFQHLEQGSNNHLRAFAAQLKQAGGTYVSTQLGQTEFDNIANSTPGRGNQGQAQRGKQGQGRGKQAGGNQPQRGQGRGNGGGQSKGRGGKGRGR